MLKTGGSLQKCSPALRSSLAVDPAGSLTFPLVRPRRLIAQLAGELRCAKHSEEVLNFFVDLPRAADRLSNLVAHQLSVSLPQTVHGLPGSGLAHLRGRRSFGV